MTAADKPQPNALPSPPPRGQLARWAVLVVMTLVLIRVLKMMSIPANLLLGALISGITVAVSGFRAPRVPRTAFCLAQGVVGCLIAKSIQPETVRNIMTNWPLFVAMVMSVSLVACLLGWLLARTQILPGTTAVWGTSPGAALLMTVMSESYGADSRLVAFMQYFRVLMVTLAATLITRFSGGVDQAHLAVLQAASNAADWFPAVNWPALAQTMLLAGGGMLLGVYTRFTTAPMIFPLVVGGILSSSGLIRIELPWWLLATAYVVVGWNIGFRFTRPIVAHALRALPKIALTTLTMIVICAGLGLVFGRLAGMDVLTSYLATSPGGMDSVAIIAASSNADLSLVMAVQTTRFILVTLTSPYLASFIARRTGMIDSQKKA